MKLSFWIVVIASGFAIVPTLHAAQRRRPMTSRPFWSSLKPGTYKVGFRVIYFRDHRPWLSSATNTTPDPGRPIRLSVWYPANPAPSANAMRYGDYLHHSGPADFQPWNDKMDQLDRESWLSDLRDEVPDAAKMFAVLRALPAAAYRDAPAVPGQFPLFLFSGGKASRADANVELAEYLASHGYVVAIVPQLGPSPQELELGSSPREIGLHADDYDAALIQLHTLPNIDFQHIAVGGHSAGGEVAVELAFRHSEVNAVVGLDASYGMLGGVRVLRQLPGYVSGRQMNAALLDLRRAEGSQDVKLDLTAIDALHWPEIYRLVFDKAYHGDFTEWGMIAYVLSIPMPANSHDHTRELGYRVNVRVCEAVLYFLEARLRSRVDALTKFLSSVQNPGIAYTHVGGGSKAPQN